MHSGRKSAPFIRQFEPTHVGCYWVLKEPPLKLETRNSPMKTTLNLATAQARSADFQSAVSRISNPQVSCELEGNRRFNTLPTGSRRLARSRPLARPSGPCSRCARSIPCAASQAAQVSRLETGATSRATSWHSFLLGLALLLFAPGSLRAATTITDTNHFAYGANVGWIECRGDVANGAVIGEYICTGYLWAANVGWIRLGSGTPANGIHYQNNSSTDWGVNHDGLGNPREYAWGANIGWIAFETNGAPKVDLWTGKLSGSVWSANCGWISLSNAVALVQTATIAPGTDSDGDGIPDAWELHAFGNLTTANATSDADGDGMSDRDEYLADTNPVDASSNLRITYFSRGTPTPSYNVLQWTARPTRFYAVDYRSALTPPGAWTNLVTFPTPGASSVGFDDFGSQQFYRVRVFRPLMP